MPSVTAAHWSPDLRSVMDGAGATLTQVVIKAGRVAGRHHHDFEQFLFVVSGGGRLDCEAGPIELAPGTALHLEAGAWHSAEFTSDTILMEVNLRQ